MPLLFFILIWPLAEIWLMIQVGQQVGALATVLLIIATAAIGLLLVQLEWQRLRLVMRDKMQQGETPIGAMLESAAVGLAGILLFIPGFISDFIGLLLLLPFTRKLLVRPLQNRSQGTIYQHKSTHYQQRGNKEVNSANVLEGEFERKDEEKDDK